MSTENAGFAEITSYGIEWKLASGNWDNFTNDDSILLSWVLSISVVDPPENYIFWYRAKNVFGWGPYSDTTTLQGIDEPS